MNAIWGYISAYAANHLTIFIVLMILRILQKERLYHNIRKTLKSDEQIEELHDGKMVIKRYNKKTEQFP